MWGLQARLDLTCCFVSEKVNCGIAASRPSHACVTIPMRVCPPPVCAHINKACMLVASRSDVSWGEGGGGMGVIRCYPFPLRPAAPAIEVTDTQATTR